MYLLINLIFFLFCGSFRFRQLVFPSLFENTGGNTYGYSVQLAVLEVSQILCLCLNQIRIGRWEHGMMKYTCGKLAVFLFCAIWNNAICLSWLSMIYDFCCQPDSVKSAIFTPLRVGAFSMVWGACFLPLWVWDNGFIELKRQFPMVHEFLVWISCMIGIFIFHFFKDASLAILQNHFLSWETHIWFLFESLEQHRLVLQEPNNLHKK